MKRIFGLAVLGLSLAACDVLETVRPDLDGPATPGNPGGSIPPIPAPIPMHPLIAAFSFTSSWTHEVLPMLPNVHQNLAQAGGLAINESGWVAGQVRGPFDGMWFETTRAAIWSPAGQVQELGVLAPFSASKDSYAQDINDGGVVVGWGTTQNASGQCCPLIRGFVWSAADGMRALQPLTTANAGLARAFGINGSGVIAGTATDSLGVLRAVVWHDSDQPPTAISIPGAQWSGASDINDAGQVVGSANVVGTSGAFRWTPSTGVEFIEDPNGDAPLAQAINNYGVVVGTLWLNSGGARPFRWTPADGLQDLGLPTGAADATAHGVNDAGHIAVTATFVDPNTFDFWTGAFLWVDGVWIDLQSQDVAMSNAVALNESLQVAGTGIAALTGGYSAIRWNVTLVPTTTVPTYTFDGFRRPISNPPVINRVKAGRAIPVKFGLGGDQGLDIFAAGYPMSQPIACDGGAPVDSVEETSTPGASQLSYDPIADEYSYVWGTDQGWAGTCRRLTVRFIDGTEHYADFAFVR